MKQPVVNYATEDDLQELLMRKNMPKRKKGTSLKILAISPLELPYTAGARYTGLERLALQFAEQWAKLGHEVSLLAHKDTDVPRGITLLPCAGYETIRRPDHAEFHAFREYQGRFRLFDAIWDIGHLHLTARFMSFLPTVSVFSANPLYEAQAGHVKAPYNLVSWSKWGIRQIARFYDHGMPSPRGGQQSVYQETIMVDPEIYKPSGTRGDRFLTMGRMSAEKGNLNAVMMCKELGLPLDVAGGRGSEVAGGQAIRGYEKEVMDNCDGKQIKFYGEVSEEEKVDLMQHCRALLYVTDHVEITSHKIQEAMLCGAPVVIPNHGGFPEIVTHGVDGWLCNNREDFIDGIKNLDKLTPEKTRPQLVEKYSPENTAKGYIKLLEEVANGRRW